LFRWEDEHSLKGSDFDIAMAHLKRQGIMELSDQLGVDNLSNRILNFALDPFRWDVTLSVPAPGTSNDDSREPRAEAESGTPGGNPNSIGALLNAAEYIAGSTQVQQLPSVRNSLIADRTNSTPPVPEETHPSAGEEVLHGSEWDATASRQPETWSNREESRGLQSQAEALDLHRKRRRVDSFPSLDPSFSQPSIGPIYKQGGATEETSLSGAKAQDARQVGSGMKMAIMAEVDKLESTLGGYLFEGMNTSRMRLREKDGGRMRFTDSVRLHVAYREGEDFKLEVWLCLSIGKAISQAKMRSVEDLRNMLGDYLFEVMKTSNRRKEEEKTGMSDCTGAVNVSFPHSDNGSDCKMEVMLNFGMGIRVFADIYPGTV